MAAQYSKSGLSDLFELGMAWHLGHGRIFEPPGAGGIRMAESQKATVRKL
jgi:hypothetical protein